MGLNFWGGFAGGMSASIEKERDRTHKKKIADEKLKVQQDKLIAEQQAKQYELSVATRAAFDEVNEKITKIKSGDTALTNEEAVGEVNALNKQKLDMYKTAMDYGINIEMKDPRSVIDITSEGIENLKIRDINGKRFIGNSELLHTIDNSDGQLVLDGERVMNRVMEQNSQGVWVPTKNEDGTYAYEDSGTSLVEFNTMFKEDASKTGNTNEERYIQDYLKTNLPEDASDTEISSMRMKAASEYRNMVKPTSVKEQEEKNSAIRFGDSYVQTKYATTLDKVDWNIVSKEDKEKLSEYADMGIRMTLGTKAPEINAEVKQLENSIGKMAESSAFIQGKIDSGEDVNILKHSIRQYLTSFFGYSEEDAEVVANNKSIVTELNQQRHALYGSVLTPGENANYTQQASSLFRSNKDLFIATKQMVKNNVNKLEEIEAKIGKKLFKMKFGNVLVDSKKKLSLLNKAETKKVSALDRAKIRRDKKESANKRVNDPIYKRFQHKMKGKSQEEIDRAYDAYNVKLKGK